ncbi:MAG: hypothetical protein PVH26_01850 [Desulfosarcina sp.]
MDWNLKGKGRTPHKNDQATSDYGVKQNFLQEKPGNGNNDFTNHQGKNDNRNPGNVPRVIIDKVNGGYASQSGVDKSKLYILQIPPFSVRYFDYAIRL